MSESTLEVLRRMHEEQKHRLFPKSTTSRPEEYSNLYAEWAEFDGFVAGLAMRALAGEQLSPTEIEPYGPRYRKLMEELQRFEQEYPEVHVPLSTSSDSSNESLDQLRGLSNEEQG